MRSTTLEVDTELAGARKAALDELFDSPGGDPACNQCRDSSQRGMLLGERASLAAALIGSTARARARPTTKLVNNATTRKPMMTTPFSKLNAKCLSGQ